MKRGQWIFAGAGVGMLAMAFAWAFRSPAVPVEVATVRTGLFEQVIEEDGKTRVRERYVVSAPLAGRLSRIVLHAGDAVEAGAVLAQLSPSAPSLLDARTMRELEERIGAAEAARAQAQANVARAEAALEQARADQERSNKLAGEGFLSRSAREQAQLAVKLQTRLRDAAAFEKEGSDHNLAQARAALLRVRDVRAGTRKDVGWQITSPLTGRVLRVLQESEAVVPIGTPLMEIADANDLEIVVDVLSSDAVRIPKGASVRVESGGPSTLPGIVRLVEPAAFTKVSALGVEEQRVNVVIELDSASDTWGALGDGYRADVRIVVFARPDAVLVPVSALFRQGESWAVFVERAGEAVRTLVEVSGRNPQVAWVAEGVKAGDRVVVYPSDSVDHGRRVKVVRGG